MLSLDADILPWPGRVGGDHYVHVLMLINYALRVNFKIDFKIRANSIYLSFSFVTGDSLQRFSAAGNP